jgi:hypothetical protein
VLISGLELLLDNITFDECKGTDGGAIFATITGYGRLTITN